MKINPNTKYRNSKQIQNPNVQMFQKFKILNLRACFEFRISDFGFITRQSGQSLVEVLVGLATAVLIIGAITIATISALQNAQFSKNQNLATNYAQQGVEIVRNLRDQNYSKFNQLDGSYCLAKQCNQIDPTNGSGNDPCGPKSILCNQNVGGENADIFVRQVTITKDDPNCQDSVTPVPGREVKVSVNVSWYDSKCGISNVFCHNVTLSTCLSTYNTVSSQ